MIEIIRDYLEEIDLPEIFIKKKLSAYSRNMDIAEEFTHWIKTKVYKDGIQVCGYTAGEIADMSGYLNGEGVFSLLITMRENPDKVNKKIQQGFRMK